MAMIDPDQERRRLAEFYSQQMDGELEKVAGQAYELTELALEALRTEIAKRGLGVEFVEDAPVPPAPAASPGDPPPDPSPAEPLPDGELEMRKMVTIRNFRDLPTALLAKGSLDSAGIDCVLVDDNVVRLDWFWSNAIGGIKLEVDAENVEAANEILEQPIPDGFDVEGIGEYRQPHCPQCQSLDVTFKELNRPVSYITVWLHVPIPVYRRAWRCLSCNVEWEDDGVADPTASGT
jgi:hypothetical protein